MGGPSSFGRPIPGGRLPALGERGEGWIAIQLGLELAVLIAGPFTGIAVDPGIRFSCAVVGLAGILAGAALFAAGARELGASFSVWQTPVTRGRLTMTGPYRWVRHPVCTAQVVLLLGWSVLSISPAGLVGTILVAAYLEWFKLAVEEAWLGARYPDYAAYAAAVPHRMLPWPPAGAADPVGRVGRPS